MAVIQLPGATDKLIDAQRFMMDWWQAHQFPEAARFPFDLALEELFVNVATHGRSCSETPPTVRVSLTGTITDSHAKVTMTVSDDGAEFNPMTRETPSITATIHDRAIGGMGLHLTRTVMDAINYRHEDGFNVTTVSKKFDS